MKVAIDTTHGNELWLKPLEFRLPGGLIGLPEIKHLELLINPEEAPLMWLRCPEQEGVGFVVIEPSELVPGYEIEVSDEDAASLGVEDAGDLLILNIVTLRGEGGTRATVNLIGPLLVNRASGFGKQVVIANFQHYSARHPLVSAEVVS
ncbi:MAG: flagellar assembly protein FliW [Puniceicoccaceae bacterium]|nr:MAG: flagellar assembly protein FliW [Puniceicoccaceae bacterium]